MHFLPKLNLKHCRIVLLTDGYSTPFLGKTAMNLLRYRRSDIAAILDRQHPGQTAHELFGCGGTIPVVASITEVADADAMYIGIAPPGGRLPAEWDELIKEAIRNRLDIVSGLHDFLNENTTFTKLAEQSDSKLVDVRRNDFRETASCYQFRSDNTRILTVGQDCSVGKMVAAIEIARGLENLNHPTQFLATGQTGMMISGSGIPIDCIIADFINGAAEALARSGEASEYSIIEGQGSLTHPAFSGVTMGLLHGTAPDGLVFCYEAQRRNVKGLDEIPLPPLESHIELFLRAANLRHPCRLIGIAVNSRNLSSQDAEREIDRVGHRFNVPSCDVYRQGADKLVEACIQLREGNYGHETADL